MSLTEENRAALKLVLGRGRSYAEIASLLGEDEERVRSDLGSVLDEMAGPDVPPFDREAVDYLLGQGDELSTVAMERRLRADPELAERIAEVTEQLQLVVPSATRRSGAETEPSPAPVRHPDTGAKIRSRGSKPPARATADAETSRAKRPAVTGPARHGLTPGHRRLVAVLLSSALLLAILILLLTGVLGGSGEDRNDDPSPAPTTAALTAVDGASGSGSAQIGFSSAGDLAVNLQLADLVPSPDDKTYTIWFEGPRGAFPIGQAPVGPDGVLAQQIPLAGPEICLVANDVFSRFRVTLVGRNALKRHIKAREKLRNDDRLPGTIGRPVLTGRISMPQAARDQIVRRCSEA